MKERYEASIEPETVEVMTKPVRLGNQDLSAELHLIKSPTLVIWGADDRSVRST